MPAFGNLKTDLFALERVVVLPTVWVVPQCVVSRAVMKLQPARPLSCRSRPLMRIAHEKR